MPRGVQGLGKLQMNTLPASSCFQLSRFPKPDAFVSLVTLSDSPPITWICKLSASATSFDKSPAGLALIMWRTILLLLILWPHSYQLHWPLVLVLRETKQSISIHLLHVTHDYMDHYHVPSRYSFFHAEKSQTTPLFRMKKLFYISDHFYCPSWFSHEVIQLQYTLLCLVLYSYRFFSLLPPTKLLPFELDSISSWNFFLRRCISWLLKFKWDLLYNSSGISQWWLKSYWFLFIPLKSQNYHILWDVTSKCCFVSKFIPELVVWSYYYTRGLYKLHDISNN